MEPRETGRGRLEICQRPYLNRLMAQLQKLGGTACRSKDVSSSEKIMPTIEWIAVDALKPNARNARTHSRKQIRQIADSIATFGFLVPILVDEGRVVIAGHGRYAAAKLLGLKQVPAIEVRDLSEAKRRALALADNKIADNAG